MVTSDLVNIGSGNGLVPDGTKPLPEPMQSHRMGHGQRLNLKWIWNAELL